MGDNGANCAPFKYIARSSSSSSVDEDDILVDDVRAKLSDQLMRIRAPAARLRDVRRVRQDASGLTRARSRIVQTSPNMLVRTTSVTNTGRVVSHPVAYCDDTEAAEPPDQHTPDRPRQVNSPGIQGSGQLRRSLSAIGRSLPRSRSNAYPMRSASVRVPRPSQDTAPPAPPEHDDDRASPRRESVPRAISHLPRRSLSMSRARHAMPCRRQSARGSPLPSPGSPDLSAPGSPESVSGSPAGMARSALAQLGRSLSRRRTVRSPASQQASEDSTSPVSAASPDGGREGALRALKTGGRRLSIRRTPRQETWSPRDDGRANKFFFSEVKSKKIGECGVLQDGARLRIPVLTLAEYSGSRHRWFVDPFTLPHNAVRKECMDLYDVIIAIANLCGPVDVTMDDMADFFDFWNVARAFFVCYFEAERKVLFPWVDAVENIGEDVRTALRNMRGMKESLRSLLTRVDDAWKMRHDINPACTFSNVYIAIDAFVPKLMNYLADQEILLPAVVKAHYAPECRVKIDRELVAAFLPGGAEHNIVLLVRWMDNAKLVRAWAAKNLASADRNSLPKWFDAFEHEHHRIVKMLRNRTA